MLANKQGIKLCSEYKKYNKRHNVKALNSIPWCLCVVLALKNCVHKKSPTEIRLYNKSWGKEKSLQNKL